MRIVVALGGNALLRRGDPMTVEAQQASIGHACGPLAAVAEQHELVVTHGNGPQVGLLALQATAYDPDAPYRFDVLDAQTEGMIGYLLEQELGNRMDQTKVVTAMLTRVVVSSADPSFRDPTKFVGPTYDEATAQRLEAEHGWTFRSDGGRPRRVVPSPVPLAILELEPIEWVLERGAVVICVGGGGIPVAVDPATGRLQGVDAVVDKDLASAVLALAVDADLLVIATDVAGVVEGWGTPSARTIGDVHPRDLDPADYPAGSMRPKVAAAARFAFSGRGDAVVGPIDDLPRLVDGTAGTRVSLRAARTTYRD